MIYLTHESENTIEFEGVSYELNLSYNVVLTIFEVLNDDDLTPKDSLDTALYLLTGRDEEEIELSLTMKVELLKLIFETHIGNTNTETFVERDLEGNPMPTRKAEAPYSFKYDAELIYASFMHAYQIDLIKQQGKMQWKYFKALVAGLPEDTIFKKIVNIRTSELPEGKHSEKERKELIKLKAIYSLPEEEEGEEN